MRKLYYILIAIVGLSMVPLTAQTTPEGLVRDILVGLSTDFTQKNLHVTFHPTIAVLTIEEASDDVKKHRVSDALYPLIEALLKRSTIFELVERTNLEAIIKEQELTLTGLTADGKVSLGGLKEAEYILKGSLSELGEDIQLSLSLVSIQDGTITASRTGLIPKNVLIASADEFSAKYVSQYGIGLEIAVTPFSYIPFNVQGVMNGAGLSVDLNYRLSRDWVIYLGGDILFTTRGKDSVLGKDTSQKAVPLSDIQNIDSSFISTHPGAKIDYDDQRNLTGLFLGGAWVLNLNRDFNINIGANARFESMTQNQTYRLILASSQSQAPINITSNLTSLYLEPQLKMQWYLSPRLTLNLGYSVLLKLTDLNKMDYQYAGNNYRKDYVPSPTYLPSYGNPKPWLDPFSGKDLTYDFSAQRIFVALGFYF